MRFGLFFHVVGYGVSGREQVFQVLVFHLLDFFAHVVLVAARAGFSILAVMTAATAAVVPVLSMAIFSRLVLFAAAAAATIFHFLSAAAL